MNINELYALWSQDPYFNESTRKELQELSNNAKEIEERFYRELEFGTGGLRGIIGAGTNRMNLYTVAKASQGLARYILSSGEEAVKQGVVISYDSRNFSPEFASQAARTLTANGIRVYLSDELRPVPVLSYSVRYFKAFAGIMITASHNPSKYNGYKVYGEDGGQVPPEAATEILNNITAIEDIRTVVPDTMDDAKAKGLLTMFGSEVDAAYTDMLETLVIDRDAITRQSNMSIVYTPLHGSGNKPVRRILERVGFKNVHVVPEQELPNGDFPTVEVPNPENPAALSMAIALAKKVNADIVLGTDPDSDRVGVAARTIENGEEIYKSFTGNQIGLLLLDYVLASKKASGTLPEKSFAVTTIVSSKLAGTICQHYGVELQEVLTGFKFIGERIKLYDEEGDMSFQFGFEESYGYLTGVNVRDKDAVDAVMLIAGMAAQSFDKGESLIDRLNGLYEKYGYGFEEAVSFTLEGKEGVEKIANAMSVLRGKVTSMTAATEKNVLGGIPFDAVRDDSSLKRHSIVNGQSTSTNIDLVPSNVLLYELGGEKGLDWACVRPSGTEPKLKIYFGCYASTEAAAQSRLQDIKTKMSAFVKAEL